MDIRALREEYTHNGLSRENLETEPLKQFEIWFKQAVAAELPEPNAMSLATASVKGEPSLRTVLLKYFDSQGFVFFTNYESNKAKQIDRNSSVALLFLWLPLERQVKIKGKATRVSTAESLKYFVTRPRGSQLGAWSSSQSSIISSRRFLEVKFNEMQRKFDQGRVPLPSFWGGYRIVPHYFEFWQGRPNRLHDRFCYLLKSDKIWSIDRLAP